MRQIVYALLFRGDARRLGPDGNVVAIQATAPGCALGSTVDGEGLSATLESHPGGVARWEAELIMTGGAMFQQTGTVAFGQPTHGIRVSSVGSGLFDDADGSGCRLGATILRIDGGQGQFAGATGAVASLVVLGDGGEVTDHHLGVVYVP